VAPPCRSSKTLRIQKFSHVYNHFSLLYSNPPLIFRRKQPKQPRSTSLCTKQKFFQHKYKHGIGVDWQRKRRYCVTSNLYWRNQRKMPESLKIRGILVFNSVQTCIPKHLELESTTATLLLFPCSSFFLFHELVQRLPLCSFKCFIHQCVLRNNEFRCFWKSFSKFLKLFNGEAFVVDSGEKVTVFKLFFYGFNLFLLSLCVKLRR
jgi:hypothetical protein